MHAVFNYIFAKIGQLREPLFAIYERNIVLLKKHIKHCILKIANVINQIAFYCFSSSILLNVKFIGNKI